MAGWLNQIGRDIGTRPPYRQRIRDVCLQCNSGWMSRLENTAKRVLTPLILGAGGVIEEAGPGSYRGVDAKDMSDSDVYFDC